MLLATAGDISGDVVSRKCRADYPRRGPFSASMRTGIRYGLALNDGTGRTNNTFTHDLVCDIAYWLIRTMRKFLCCADCSGRFLSGATALIRPVRASLSFARSNGVIDFVFWLFFCAAALKNYGE